MNSKSKNLYIASAVLFVLFVVFTLMVKYIDVAPIGPENSSVGFSTLNGAIASKLPLNMTFYKISSILGYLGIATMLVFALFGVMQLIIKKDIRKVDKDIIGLGLFYVVMLLTYIFFEKVIINYRPVILDEGLEASYPSSHTMLAIGFLTVAICQFSARLKNKTTRTVVNILCLVVLIGLIITRTLSGVHWFTDILGAVLISEAWALLYVGSFILILDKNKKKKQR